MLASVDAAMITRAALDTLNEVGLDRMSMRAIAQRLGVQVGGLYYYVPDRAALLRSVCDTLCEHALAQVTTSHDWRADAVRACHALRTATLDCRDGARLLAQSPLAASDAALRLMDAMMAILERGVAADKVADVADTLFSYVTGYVLQEQLTATGFTVEDLSVLTERFPRIFARDDPPTDDTFARAIDMILRGALT